MEPSRRPGEPAVATYRGAGGTFLRTPGWGLLLDVPPAHPLVRRCWDLLTTTTDPDGLLEVIAAPGREPVPAFVLVREAGVRRVVAHRASSLVVDATDVLAGSPPGRMVDLPLAGASTVEASTVEAWTTGDDVRGPGLPLRDGVAAASGFRLVLAAATAANTPPAADTSAGGAARRADDTLPFEVRTGRPGEAATTTSGSPGRSPRPGSAATGGVEAPRVLGVVCPAGHLTPVYSGLCRVCGATVPPQEAFETARPTLGRLALPRGGSVLLDRGAVLGRAPYVPGDWGGVRPHLVALPDPEHDVSAQHVAVVLDLWEVLVCDLGSTNGTALVDAAGATTRLRAYEPAALRSGGAIVLAGVLTLPFEIQP